MAVLLCVSVFLLTGEPSDSRIHLPEDPFLVLGLLGIEESFFFLYIRGNKLWPVGLGSPERQPGKTSVAHHPKIL